MGAKSQSFGSLFETIFLKSCQRDHVSVTRVPDGCRQIGFNKLIRVKSPWDWVITYQKQTALIDTKTVQGKAFTASMIHEHQIQQLFSHEANGAIAGYVIWLRGIQKVFFVPSSALGDIKKTGQSFTGKHPGSIFLGSDSFDIRNLFLVGIQA